MLASDSTDPRLNIEEKMEKDEEKLELQWELEVEGEVVVEEDDRLDSDRHWSGFGREVTPTELSRTLARISSPSFFFSRTTSTALELLSFCSQVSQRAPSVDYSSFEKYNTR